MFGRGQCAGTPQKAPREKRTIRVASRSATVVLCGRNWGVYVRRCQSGHGGRGMNGPRKKSANRGGRMRRGDAKRRGAWARCAHSHTHTHTPLITGRQARRRKTQRPLGQPRFPRELSLAAATALASGAIGRPRQYLTSAPAHTLASPASCPHRAAGRDRAVLRALRASHAITGILKAHLPWDQAA